MKCMKCGCAAIELRDLPANNLCDRCYPQTRPVGSPTGCGCLDRRHAVTDVDLVSIRWAWSEAEAHCGRTPHNDVWHHPQHSGEIARAALTVPDLIAEVERLRTRAEQAERERDEARTQCVALADNCKRMGSDIHALELELDTALAQLRVMREAVAEIRTTLDRAPPYSQTAMDRAFTVASAALAASKEVGT